MKRSLLIGLIGLIGLVGFNGQAWAQRMPLSDDATASVLTCGKGDDFYTSFGHSALRITDTANGIDLVYNYGTFDFDTPHFYWKFMRGKLDYCLSRSTFESFLYEYTYYGRSVSEQRLTMEPGQVQNLYLLLEANYLPEYRYYKYDFLRDNCATRVRDIVYCAWGGDTILGRETKPMSYRRLLAGCLYDTLEWWRLGVDLMLGLPADHRCTAPERMFLPAEMEAEFAECSPKGIWVAPFIVEASQPMLPSGCAPKHRSFPPLVAFVLLFVAVALLSWKAREEGSCWRKAVRVVDRVLFITAGVAGCFLLFMWLGTDHWCTKWNLNVLWLSPLLILIAIRLERSPRWALWLQLVCFAVAAVWVVVCNLSLGILPLILTLSLQVALLLRYKRQ